METEKEITRRDYFAVRIFIGLMGRHTEPGYEEKAAIYEAYRLADLMVNLSGLVENGDIELKRY